MPRVGENTDHIKSTKGVSEAVSVAMSAVDALREACRSSSGGLAASSASLSPDGATLTLSGVGHDARSPVTVADGGRTASYSLASVYLLLTNPNVLRYRKACEAAGVADPVKVLDKGLVSGYFGVGGADAPGERKSSAPSSGVQFSAPSSSKRSRPSGGGRDRKHRTSSSSSRGKTQSSSSSSSAPPRKKAKAQSAPITNEMLVSNLSLIVDKRDASSAAAPSAGDEEKGAGGAADEAGADGDGPGDDGKTAPSAGRGDEKDGEDRDLLLSWLSPAGFEVANLAAEVEADRDAVRRITSLEIPVGDSSSILRAGAGGEVADASGGARRRDFARVLSIYQDVDRAEHRARHASSSSRDGGKSSRRPPPPSSGKKGAATASRSPSSSSAPSGRGRLPPGNPIIIVPNAMTSVVTMVNAPFFLGEDARYVPREVALKDPRAGKRGGTFSVTRKMASRLGGHELTYDVIDNPSTRLKRPEDWQRVVAVICQGQSWQFKGWRYSDPVELFTSAFGFYVGLDGAAVPAELRGWNVKTSRISRDRRGMDNVCMASFWNGVEEFVSVHKQGFIRP